MQKYSSTQQFLNPINISICAVLQVWSLNILQKLCKSSKNHRCSKEGIKKKICQITRQFAAVYKDFRFSESTKKSEVQPNSLGFQNRKEVLKELMSVLFNVLLCYIIIWWKFKNLKQNQNILFCNAWLIPEEHFQVH